MKGVIFTVFQQMVETEFGLECWERLINHGDIGSGGIYISVDDYPDAELFELVNNLSDYASLPVPTLIEHFGEYLLPHLIGSLPAEFFHYDDLWSLLAAIDEVIHVEVKKLNPGALTPIIKVVKREPGKMTLSYQSPRKMCLLAIGLIRQAGKHFDTPVTVTHRQCMHEGADHCVLDVALLNG